MNDEELQEFVSDERSDWPKTRIVCNPQILVGKPTIEGTRLSVEFILETIGYMSIDEMIDQFPRLTRDAILSALTYAAAVFRLEAPLPLYKKRDKAATLTIDKNAEPVLVYPL